MRPINLHKVQGTLRDVAVVEVSPEVYHIELPNGTLVLDFPAGLTNEALLAVLEDRLRQQVDAVFDGRTGGARLHVFRALGQLKVRSEERVRDGIEGTKEPSRGPAGKR